MRARGRLGASAAWGERPCHDCGVVKGQFHVLAACDSELCPKCEKAMSAHTCLFDEFGDVAGHDRPQASGMGWRLSGEATVAIFFAVLFGLLAGLRGLGLF